MSTSDEDIFAQARVQAHEDLERTSTMSDEQLDYLGRLHEIPDPDTDGLECDHGMTGDDDGG